jgi:hypothetical protein
MKKFTVKEQFEVDKTRAMSVACEAGRARDQSRADPASYASTGSGDSFGRTRRAETSPEHANQQAEFPATA